MRRSLSILVLAVAGALLATACAATPTFRPAATNAQAATLTDGEEPGLVSVDCDVDSSYLLQSYASGGSTNVDFIAAEVTAEALQPGSTVDTGFYIAGTTQPFVCVTLLPGGDGSELTCGWQTVDGLAAEIRLQPHVLSFAAYPGGASGRSYGTPPIHSFARCPDSVESPALASSSATSVDVHPPSWGAKTAEATLSEIGEWALAIGANPTPRSQADCTTLTVMADSMDTYYDALLSFLEIEASWQPIAEDWSPDQSRYDDLVQAATQFGRSGLPAALGIDNRTALLVTVPALSALVWQDFPAPGEIEASAPERIVAAYRAAAGERLARVPHGPYQVDLLRTSTSTVCDENQRESGASTSLAIGDPDASSLCRDLANVYGARIAFRAEAAKNSNERHPNLGSLLDPMWDVAGSIHQSWTTPGRPDFSNEALYSLWGSENALRAFLEENTPIDRELVRGYQADEVQIHDFARANCPGITAGIDLVSVFELAVAPDADAVSEVQQDFCAHARSMLTARVEFFSLIDPSGAAAPWSDEAAMLFQTIVDEADYLSEQVEDFELLVNPTGEPLWAASFTGLRARIAAVRLAHFEPFVVAMYRPPDGEIERSENGEELAFMSSICGSSADELASFSVSSVALNGPAFDERSYDATADDLCLNTTTALQARAGFRAYVDDASAGDRQAQTSATAFYQRFDALSWDGVAIPFELAFDELDSPRTFSSSLPRVEAILYEALTDQEISRYQLDDLQATLENRDRFFEFVETYCGEFDSALTANTDNDAALVAELIASHELPAIVSVERLCTELATVYELRAKFRRKLDAGSVYGASEQIDRITHEYNGMGGSGRELPAGFELGWLDAMRRNEGQLLSRLEYDEPMETALVRERLPKVELLEDYIGANCPAITVGLDLTPVLEVFGAVDQTVVSGAQAEFCTAVTELFEARLAFRELVPAVPGPFTDQARLAYDRILISTEELRVLVDAKELLINPDGLDFNTYEVTAIAAEESLVRQAFFGSHPIPLIESRYSNDPVGDHTAGFAKMICEDPSPVLDVAVADKHDLGAPTLPLVDEESSELASQFCPRLEALRHVQLTVRDLLDAAAAGDAAAGRDAGRVYNRTFGFEGLAKDSALALFGEEEPDNEVVFVPASLAEFLLVQALEGGEYRYRSDVDQMESQPEQLAPAALSKCEHLAPEVLDIFRPGLLELYDQLAALN